MTATTEPTARLDERQFEHYLGRDTKTNVLFVGVLADEIRRYAAERGVTLERVCTPRYIERDGRRERIGDDIKIDEAAVDLIEQAIFAAVRAMRRTVNRAAVMAEGVCAMSATTAVPINRTRLAAMMQNQGVSGRQLAKAAGYRSHTHVQRVLRGEAGAVGSDPARRIALYLGVDVDDLA